MCFPSGTALLTSCALAPVVPEREPRKLLIMGVMLSEWTSQTLLPQTFIYSKFELSYLHIPLSCHSCVLSQLKRAQISMRAASPRSGVNTKGGYTTNVLKQLNQNRQRHEGSFWQGGNSFYTGFVLCILDAFDVTHTLRTPDPGNSPQIFNIFGMAF